MDYKYLDISGDAGVRAWGQNLEEAFSAAAVGMYGLITDLESIRAEIAELVRLEGDSPEGLLVGFLNELIFMFDARGFIGRQVEYLKVADGVLEAEVMGEQFDPERHERRLLLKAATYHGLRIENADGRWTVEVIFDI